MTLITGYLTPKQRLVWDLKINGLQGANIARKLKRTTPNRPKSPRHRQPKNRRSLRRNSKNKQNEIQTVDPTKGFLLGYSARSKTQAFIIFSAKNGI
jgi:hypothetical protein